MSFIVTFLLLLPPSVLINSNASINTQQANESMNQKTTIYGCEYADNIDYLHCDPFKSEFEGNNTTYNNTKIMDITREPFYVNGVSGKAIEFIDVYIEYVEIPQNNLYNSSEISISFWVKEDNNTKPNSDQRFRQVPMDMLFLM